MQCTRSGLQCSTVRVNNLEDVSLKKSYRHDRHEKSYLEIDHRVNLNVDIVASDDHLSPDGANLDLHIHNAERFRADVNVGKARVHSLVEVSKSRNETHRSC